MYRKFFSYYKPHKRLFVIDFSSAIIVAILELAFPLAVQWFIDELLPTGDWGMIVKISVLLLLVYAISTLLNFIVNYLGHKLGLILRQICVRNYLRMYKGNHSDSLIILKQVI